jgi:putative ABC transport system permease protein
VRKQLFAELDPVGSTLRLQAISCEVVGLLTTKGQGGKGTDQDDVVLILLHTFQRRISGDRKISGIQIGFTDDSDSKLVQSEVEKLLRQRRAIQPGHDDDFMVMNSQQLLSTLTTAMTLLTALLSAIAAISLLVGGIGIMNIMLVSVTEGTREIGIRLAIGAFDTDVMIESLWKLWFSRLWAESLASLLAMVGVIFGFFPARKAARLDPIEALRHE